MMMPAGSSVPAGEDDQMNVGGGSRPAAAMGARQAGVLAAVLPGLVLLAACGGGPASPGATHAGWEKSKPLAFSACIRAHGVPGFPLSPARRGLRPPRHELDRHELAPPFQAAQKACRSLAIASGFEHTPGRAPQPCRPGDRRIPAQARRAGYAASGRAGPDGLCGRWPRPGPPAIPGGPTALRLSQTLTRVTRRTPRAAPSRSLPGLTTAGSTHEAAPDGSGSLVVALDLRTHEAVVEHSGGQAVRVPLAPDRAVGDVTREVLAAVARAGGAVKINPRPQEVSWSVPLDEDYEHASYDPRQAGDYFTAATQAALALAAFRAPYRGRSSPVDAW